MKPSLEVHLVVLTINLSSAAQRCQNYWNGRAPFCAPGGCASDAYRWWGIVSDSGNGAQCYTGMKRLCQCLAPGSLDACVPSIVPPKESKQLQGLFTTCNNGCSAYVCGVDWVKFWKREGYSRPRSDVHRRCELFFFSLCVCDSHRAKDDDGTIYSHDPDSKMLTLLPLWGS